MSYNYQTEREGIFTAKGVKLLLTIRDKAKGLLAESGAFKSGVLAGSWETLAVLDFLVEHGDIREITGPEVAGQDRVFVDARA